VICVPLALNYPLRPPATKPKSKHQPSQYTAKPCILLNSIAALNHQYCGSARVKFSIGHARAFDQQYASPGFGEHTSMTSPPVQLPAKSVFAVEKITSSINLLILALTTDHAHPGASQLELLLLKRRNENEGSILRYVMAANHKHLLNEVQ